MTRNVIRDGQTKCGYIEAMPKLHDGLMFEYRPMLSETLEAVESAAVKTDGSKGAQLVIMEVTKHLVSWSEENDKGEALPIEFDTVRKLWPSMLFNRLYRIISGQTVTDEVPGSSNNDIEDRLEEVRQAIEGKPPIVLQEEAAKN